MTQRHGALKGLLSALVSVSLNEPPHLQVRGVGFCFVTLPDMHCTAALTFNSSDSHVLLTMLLLGCRPKRRGETRGPDSVGGDWTIAGRELEREDQVQLQSLLCAMERNTGRGPQ